MINYFKKNILIINIIIILISMSFAVFFRLRENYLDDNIDYAEVIALVGILSIAPSIIYIAFMRNTSETSQYVNKKLSSRDMMQMTAKMENLLKQSQSLSYNISEEERAEIISKMAESTLDNENLLKDLSRHYYEGASAEYQNNALNRLSEQVTVLGKRANINLWSGIGFSLIGMIVLYYIFFADPPDQPLQSSQEITQTLFEYMPRLSMVLIIEFVAFFFLRLYARTLTELRYAQNEITNVELKFVALNTCLSEKQTTTLKSALTNLINTERNFILDKGQTTAEIEKERADVQGMTATVNAASSLLHGAKDKSSKIN